ncbi:MAG: DUF6194 family protein [Verrucomicrobiota bacterium]
MSMTEIEITRHITDTFPGVDVLVGSKEAGSPEVAWGDIFFSYDPDGTLAPEKKFPFATIVTKDYGDFDAASNLNRQGVFRLNIGVSKASFEATVSGEEHDFTALDKVMPHPVYGKMFWLCVLNPSQETFRAVVQPLLAEAYQRAAQKISNRSES